MRWKPSTTPREVVHAPLSRSHHKRNKRHCLAKEQHIPAQCGKVCHVFKSRKASSQRTRAGAVAYKAHKSSLHFHAKKHNNVRQNRKIKKLISVLLKTVSPMELSHLCWTRESLKSVCLVFDGGAVDTSPLKKPKMDPGDPEWKSLRISNGDLWVADTLDPEKGITYPASSGDAPFTRIPRKAALEMTGMLHKEESNRYCIALNYGYKSQRGSLHRGKFKRIYSDFKYCNMGAQACRAGRGVREYSYHKIPCLKSSGTSLLR